MADIARRAHVHPSTVSLALRGHPRIPEATRTKIARIAEDLGYTPDPLLDAFNFDRLTTHPGAVGGAVAIMTDQPSRAALERSPVDWNIYSGARDRAEKLGLALDVFFLGDAQLSSHRLNSVLAARQISSVALCALNQSQHSLELNWPKISAIGVESHHFHSPIDVLSLDYHSISRALCRRVISDVSSRTGYVTTATSETLLNFEPLTGFLLESGLETAPSVPPLILQPDDTKPLATVREWIDLHRPTDVIIGARQLGSDVYNILKSRVGRVHGLACSGPEKLRPNLEKAYQKLGAHAVELLLLWRQSNRRGLPRERTSTVFRID